MSKSQLVITALFVEHQSPAEVAERYGVHRAWVYKLKARYEAEGETALTPRSRRPKSSPSATPAATVELVLRLRKQLAEAGLDAGADTIGWHLARHHGTTLSRATINRILVRAGAVVPEPAKRPKSSYIRFEASMPNECWQSDFTHYRLTRLDGTPGADVEVLSWLDDCSRYALRVSAHHRVTGPIVLTAFRDTVAAYGIPASTLTDNGMVFTTRLSGGKGGRNGLETELRRLHVRQKNSRPNHPTTCGKVERFQQTMKNRQLLEAVRRRKGARPVDAAARHRPDSAQPGQPGRQPGHRRCELDLVQRRHQQRAGRPDRCAPHPVTDRRPTGRQHAPGLATSALAGPRTGRCGARRPRCPERLLC
jgi:transposase InsO family protein